MSFDLQMCGNGACTHPLLSKCPNAEHTVSTVKQQHHDQSSSAAISPQRRSISGSQADKGTPSLLDVNV